MRKANGNFSFTFCLAVVGILLAAFSQPVFGAIPSQERAALIALYNSTNGDNWTNKSGWKTPPLAGDGFALPGTEKSWYRITCDSGNTTVQSINLWNNNLVGTLAPELGNLDNLYYLNLGSNQLSGSIPPELGNLANLQYIYLDYNQFSGSIPLELVNLAKLLNLSLGGNQLSGSIPPELGNLANLQVLDLLGNQLSGGIPPELGNLANLLDLSLAGNRLSDSIPPELGNLVNLEFLYLSWNQLSGSIPPELGNLANLQYLFLQSNQLSGSIPPDLGNLVNLQYFDLGSNQLSDGIPPELGNLAKLQYLFLQSNQLSGSIPSTLINLTNIPENSLDLTWNALYTNDEELREFLDSKSIMSCWECTQTIAPTDVTAAAVSAASIEIGWTPFIYPFPFDTGGGYRVFYSTIPGGPYTYFGMTADKTASSLPVTGLNPGITYYFVVQTRTYPHTYNQNTVDSEYSAEVSAATLQNITISGKVTIGGSGLTDVTITLSNGGGTAVTDADGNYSVMAYYGWSGTATPSKTGYKFTPINRSYSNVTVNQTGQDYVAAISSQERSVLIALYNSTDGDNWTNNSGWKTPPLAADGFALPGTENTWYGITFDSGNTTVQSINLSNNNLNGALPQELANLANLEYLNLGSNQLSGSINPELGNLAKLQSLILYYNQISGTIPPELGNLAKLQSLILYHNQISGTIPPELGNLANLQELSLGYNQLSGAIPPELGNLANLQWLTLSTNQLSGAIPPELGNLVNLQDLSLYGNQLSGSIPPELGNLANLIDLYLYSNQLSGAIPPELGNLANLQYLNLHYNQLSGSIPPELGNLASLLVLLLGSNQLSGSIPPELGNLVNLRAFYLNSNQLSGSIPSTLTNLTNLYNDYLNLKWNALYTNDDILRAFLDSKQNGGNWEGTQTIAPTNVTAASVSTTSIDINWTPIAYTFDTGGYRVFYSTTTGGPYTYFGITADKTASSLPVTGLNANTTYYFVVQTRTNSHFYNKNAVDSEYSAEVSAETFSVTFTISGAITSGGSGLTGVTITLSDSGGTTTTDANGNYSVTVPYGWSGTATPSKSGYNFSPANRSYTNVTVNQTSQDYMTAIPSQERSALIALYNSTDGDNWTNNSGWKTPPLAGDGFALPGTENTWYGITFDSGNTTVQSINLSNNNLNGALPQELGNLANLEYLNLGSNQLSGSIPPELGDLANLQYLDLSWNHISGSIPPELASLANLYYLYLQQNQFSGSIPPELASLDNLLYLYLNGNQLSGSIPSELANLLNLQELWLFNNQLSGTIPPGLGSLANLRYLYLDANQLSGSIPPELGNLANLIFLGLGTNQFSGTIPLELTNLAKLQVLILSKNQLSGGIPPELGNLANLEQLFLDSNQLSGTIAPELGNLAKLYIIDLSSNSLSGTIPPELGNPANLNNIDFSSNNLSGSIPLELVNLANLWSLDLSANSLSGSIPSELGNRANLHYLYLNSNQLSGSIPPELGNLANLREFHLNSNQFSGSIPSSLINLTNLYDGSSDLKWNALYTDDASLRTFLNSKQSGGNWESTQTIAPTNVTAASVSTTSIDINWTPIAYTFDTGGYRVFYSTTTGGPYTYFGITADKTASSLPVTGLNPNTTYYFVVQTWTNPHGYNQNTVDSEYSAEVSAKTLQDITGLTLTSPNGGENWKLSSSHNITWNASGISGLLKITLWRAGSQIGVIANNINPAAGAYPWIVGKYIGGMAIPGADYRIKIKEIGTLTADTGNANFTLSPGITVMAPNGGQTWKIGNVKQITWRSGGLTNQIKITLWKDNVLVGTIANVAPAGGSFSWTVGNYIGGTAAPGPNYKIKIKEIGTIVSDTSDSAFTLIN